MQESERRYLAALAAGAEINPDEERAKFDAWLDSEPEAIRDPERFELKQALGLQ